MLIRRTNVELAGNVRAIKEVEKLRGLCGLDFSISFNRHVSRVRRVVRWVVSFLRIYFLCVGN